MLKLFANSGDPDQMLHSAASDLGLHCLPVTHLGVSSLQWVNIAFACHTAEKLLRKISDNSEIIFSSSHSGSVVEHLLCDREVAGSIPGLVIPKTLKMVLAALSLGAQH